MAAWSSPARIASRRSRRARNAPGRSGMRVTASWPDFLTSECWRMRIYSTSTFDGQDERRAKVRQKVFPA